MTILVKRNLKQWSLMILIESCHLSAEFRRIRNHLHLAMLKSKHGFASNSKFLVSWFGMVLSKSSHLHWRDLKENIFKWVVINIKEVGCNLHPWLIRPLIIATSSMMWRNGTEAQGIYVRLWMVIISCFANFNQPKAGGLYRCLWYWNLGQAVMFNCQNLKINSVAGVGCLEVCEAIKSNL